MKEKLTEKTIRHYTEAQLKGSTGALNSMFEVAVRRAVYRGKQEIEFTTASGKVDMRVGRSCWIEIKSCCSEVGYDDAPLMMIERAKYVLYTPELPPRNVIENDALSCLECCYLFTSEQFIEVLKAMHKGGTEPHIKRNSNGHWNIQTLATRMKNGNWTTKPLDRFYDFCEENNIPTATLELIDSLR